MKCKYCGKSFRKKHNRQVYCSKKCRDFALKEQKAEYQRKRRKLIKNNELFNYEKEFIGTQFLSKRRNKDFDKEKQAILKEMRRLKLRYRLF